MALTIPGLDAALFDKFKSGDLGALEKLFRTAFPALLAKAKEDLDDDGAAARVVERLIPRLFAERAGFKSVGDVTQFLDETVHDAAVREKSRLAGIRKGDTGRKTAAPSIDEVWGKVAATISGPTAEQLAEAARMKDKLAHEASSHIKAATTKRPWYVTAGLGLVMAGVVAAGMWYFAKSGEDGRLGRQVTALDVREVKTGTGQRGNVTLDDGTTARVGAESKIIVPKEFNETTRGIGIEGAAEFKVFNDPKPFQVLAKNVIVTATGTTFSVSSYSNIDGVIVAVSEGTVQISVEEPKKSEHTISAGETMAIDAAGATAKASDVQLNEGLGYLRDSLWVSNRTLKYALGQVKRWYGTDLFLADTTLGSQMVTVSAPLGSSTDAIKAMEAASGLVFGWEGQTMVLKVDPKKK
jgi:ferric-dicitrate binding protein FerR (iron transport regulator)